MSQKPHLSNLSYVQKLVAIGFRWLGFPFSLLALATGSKSFHDNPIIGSPKLNRAGLHIARVRIAAYMAGRRRKRLLHLVSDQDRNDFDRDGFVLKSDFLSPDAFADLVSELAAAPGEIREMRQGHTVTRRMALDATNLKRMPATKAVLSDERWQGLISYVSSFRCYPMNYLQTILAHAHEGPPDPQTFLHSDTFHPTVKAWLFLTDVELGDGPFTYVPGSHRLNRRRLAWLRRQSINARSLDRMSARGSFRVTEDELRLMGYPKPRAITVKKNTLVVADTAGFHARGVSSHASTRMEIWGYSRRNPFLPWVGLDIQGMPGLNGRVVPLFWRARDIGESLGLRKNPWRLCREKEKQKKS